MRKVIYTIKCCCFCYLLCVLQVFICLCMCMCVAVCLFNCVCVFWLLNLYAQSLNASNCRQGICVVFACDKLLQLAYLNIFSNTHFLTFTTSAVVFMCLFWQKHCDCIKGSLLYFGSKLERHFKTSLSQEINLPQN